MINDARDLKTQRICCSAIAVLISVAVTAASAAEIAAQAYPSKPIRLVVPYPPGGTMDFIGHVLGGKIALAIGHNLLVDNRGGAGGAIGTEVVAKSPPDGYTILLSSSSHATLPSVSKSLPYDAAKDFTPITLVARSVGSVLVVHPSVPARSVRELVALAKAHPGKLSYGSGGVGGVVQFAAESFNMMAGTQIMHIPYKGVGQSIIDLLAGRTEVGFVTATSWGTHVRSGKLRPLGITAPARWSELADVPTLDEAGVKGYQYATWYGLWFPSSVPAEYVTRIRAEVTNAFGDPGMKRAFTERGFNPVASTPQEFNKTILDEIEVHRRLVARIGLIPQ